jgi:hypothetical protein
MEFIEKRGQTPARVHIEGFAIASVHDRNDKVIIHTVGGGEYILFITYDDFMARWCEEDAGPAPTGSTGEETEADENLREATERVKDAVGRNLQRALARIEQMENATSGMSGIEDPPPEGELPTVNGDDVVGESTYSISEDEPSVDEGDATESATLAVNLATEDEQQEDE